MMLSLLILVLGLAVLTAGAESLVRGGAGLAGRLGIPPVVIGLTVVAFGTSAPELAVSIRAALAGQGAIAAGNVIGSNIFNIAAILGLAALICPLAVHARLIRLDMPLMIAVSLLGVVILHDQAVSRFEGLVLIAGLVTYTGATILLSLGKEPEFEREAAAEVPKPARSAWIEGLQIGGGLVGLVLGARWFVQGAAELARLAGLGEALIGLTIVAAGTSLPELATSVVAALRRHTDIAVGNIVGSNIFNLLGILGTAALIKPFTTAGIMGLDLAVMLALAIILLPMAMTGFVLKRWEGAFLLLGYAIYLGNLLINK